MLDCSMLDGARSPQGFIQKHKQPHSKSLLEKNAELRGMAHPHGSFSAPSVSKAGNGIGWHLAGNAVSAGLP